MALDTIVTLPKVGGGDMDVQTLQLKRYEPINPTQTKLYFGEGTQLSTTVDIDLPYSEVRSLIRGRGRKG